LQVELVRAVSEVASKFHPEFIILDEGPVRIDVVSWVGRVTTVFGINSFDPYRPQEGVYCWDGDFTFAFQDFLDYVSSALSEVVVQPCLLYHSLYVFVGELSEAFDGEHKVRAEEV
jgi:hypothetical protein